MHPAKRPQKPTQSAPNPCLATPYPCCSPPKGRGPPGAHDRAARPHAAPRVVDGPHGAGVLQPPGGGWGLQRPNHKAQSEDLRSWGLSLATAPAPRRPPAHAAPPLRPCRASCATSVASSRGACETCWRRSTASRRARYGPHWGRMGAAWAAHGAGPALWAMHGAHGPCAGRMRRAIGQRAPCRAQSSTLALHPLRPAR
jgi:hypothetical protein